MRALSSLLKSCTRDVPNMKTLTEAPGLILQMVTMCRVLYKLKNICCVAGENSSHRNQESKLDPNTNTEAKTQSRSITFPVVCPYSPKVSRSLSSLMASGLSILLPRIRIGTLAMVSSVISDCRGKEKGETNAPERSDGCYSSPGGSRALPGVRI